MVKEGANKGRHFYGCAKPREESCGFFAWADEQGNGGGGPRAQTNGRGAPTVPQKRRAPTAPRVRFFLRVLGTLAYHSACLYSIISKIATKTTRRPANADSSPPFSQSRKKVSILERLTIERPLTPMIVGPNQGRSFYKCSKISKSSQCGYFAWADEIDSGDRNVRQRSMSREVTASRNNGGPAPTGECFNCGESESHRAWATHIGADGSRACVMQPDIGREIALKDGLVASNLAALDPAAVQQVARPENASNAEKVC